VRVTLTDANGVSETQIFQVDFDSKDQGHHHH
jgi:hypothetical protein